MTVLLHVNPPAAPTPLCDYMPLLLQLLFPSVNRPLDHQPRNTHFPRSPNVSMISVEYAKYSTENGFFSAKMTRPTSTVQ